MSSKERSKPLRTALRQIRASLDLTQTDMCRELKISPSYLSQMENGKRPLTNELLARIEKRFCSFSEEIKRLRIYTEQQKRVFEIELGEDEPDLDRTLAEVMSERFQIMSPELKQRLLEEIEKDMSDEPVATRKIRQRTR